jgi:hypothetical protein
MGIVTSPANQLSDASLDVVICHQALSVLAVLFIASLDVSLRNLAYICCDP